VTSNANIYVRAHRLPDDPPATSPNTRSGHAQPTPESLVISTIAVAPCVPVIGKQSMTALTDVDHCRRSPLQQSGSHDNVQSRQITPCAPADELGGNNLAILFRRRNAHHPTARSLLQSTRADQTQSNRVHLGSAASRINGIHAVIGSLENPPPIGRHATSQFPAHLIESRSHAE